MEHGETIEASIKRELREEIAFEGNFTYKVWTIHDPMKLLTRDVWQLKIVLEVQLDGGAIGVGEDADEVSFILPEQLKNSEHESERRIYECALSVDAVNMVR